MRMAHIISAILTLACASAQAGEAPGLWKTYDDALRHAKYIDLTHTVAPGIPVWHGFGSSKFAPTVNPASGKPYTYKADGFEAGVLQKFADPGYPRQGEKIISEAAEGGKILRVMLPLYYGKGCLACHGEPKGEKDISGYKKEGAKEGDLGGAISVKLPLK